MGRQGYPAEFRRKVLDLLAEGKSVASIAHELDVSEQTIYTWRRQDRIDRGEQHGLTALRRLTLAALPAWNPASKVEVASIAPLGAVPALEEVNLCGVQPVDRSMEVLWRVPSLRRARLARRPGTRRRLSFALPTGLHGDGEDSGTAAHARDLHRVRRPLAASGLRGRVPCAPVHDGHSSPSSCVKRVIIAS